MIAGKKEDLRSLVCKAQEDATQWLEINPLEIEVPRFEGFVSLLVEKRWTKPQVGVLKCNVSVS